MADDPLIRALRELEGLRDQTKRDAEAHRADSRRYDLRHEMRSAMVHETLAQVHDYFAVQFERVAALLRSGSTPQLVERGETEVRKARPMSEAKSRRISSDWRISFRVER